MCSLFYLFVNLDVECVQCSCSVFDGRRVMEKKNPKHKHKIRHQSLMAVFTDFHWNLDKSSCSSSLFFFRCFFFFLFFFIMPIPDGRRYLFMYTITANSIPSLQRIGSIKLSRVEKTLECSMFTIQSIYFRLEPSFYSLCVLSVHIVPLEPWFWWRRNHIESLHIKITNNNILKSHLSDLASRFHS